MPTIRPLGGEGVLQPVHRFWHEGRNGGPGESIKTGPEDFRGVGQPEKWLCTALQNSFKSPCHYRDRRF